MDNVLIKDEKYSGQYVVVKGLEDPEVIASGDDPQEIYKKAIEKGFSDPLILFVPNKDMVQIY